VQSVDVILQRHALFFQHKVERLLSFTSEHCFLSLTERLNYSHD
jgi:hypothetical protein